MSEQETLDEPIAPVGRPTKYDPAFCERVEELGRQGKSKPQMAAAFGVCRQTIDNWAEQNPDFLEALLRAETFAQAWWENKGQKAINFGPSEFNSLVWKKSMEARFRHDYTERKELDHSGLNVTISSADSDL